MHRLIFHNFWLKMLHTKKNYRILQVLPHFNMGGVEQGALDLACYLEDKGHKAFIATTSGNKIIQAKAKGVHVIQLPVASKNPYILLKNIHNFTRICKEFSIDLIHARSRAPAISAYMACKKLHIPFVTTFHGTYNFNNFIKKYYNSIMVRGDRVIAISHFIKNHIRQHYSKWIHEDKIRLIHRGVDIDYFNPACVDSSIQEALKKEWRLPPQEPVFLMPGRLTRWKGQEAVIKMLTALPKGVVVFLGSDQGRTEYSQQLKTLALSLGISERVRFIDSCPTMREAYGLSTVVLHASTDPEGFGRVIAEAQAMGKPILTSIHGAGREIILDKTGWLIDPNNIDDMVNTLNHVLTLSPTVLSALQQKARNRVIENFSRDLMMEKTLEVYKELLTHS